MLAAKGLLEALAQADDGEPMDKNTAEDKDLGEVLKFCFGENIPENPIVCGRDCEKCKSLNGRAEKNGQPWGYECMKYGDTIDKDQLHSTKTFRR